MAFISNSASIALCAAVVFCSPVHAGVKARYIQDGSLNLIVALPQAPRDGSAIAEADRMSFRGSRVLIGSHRWKTAIADVNESVPYMLEIYSEAAGVQLSEEKTPKLAALLADIRPELDQVVGPAKHHFKRPRPFLLDEGVVCQDRSDLEGSYDYPSGHTTWGTAVALIIAELIPERASRIVARGRDYGESRIVCGAHTESAVQAGRFAASAFVARLHGEASFRTALDEIRIEVAKSGSVIK